ncbi:uncharacterized protein TM35_000053250 [Trypanosoma theileri]|uniref:Uncharacterized protein n=1 Tax=Trypanosoma theileri TaxID=67003 RepID=A0A1X0P5A3_9TRYP|nr:uncharacterized protein TM35_000053250 [Trypanosoma theileri]ORC91729.1 hypothetical protein TM35_000053250 [Trypanosoma theileri]
MITDRFPLRVKLGGPVLDVMNLFQIREDLTEAQATVSNSRNALAKTRITPSRKGEVSQHRDEEEALKYAAKKREYLNNYYLSESIFSEFQRILVDIAEEERGARQRLDVFHKDIKSRAVNARRAEYFMSTKCVVERFEMEERAYEDKVRMMQEHADYLLSLKIVEEEQRQVAIRRAQTRRMQCLQQSTGVSVPYGVPGTNNMYYSPSPAYGYGRPPPPPQQPQLLQSQQYANNPIPMQTRPYELPPAFLEMQERRKMGIQQQQQQQPQTGFYASSSPVPYVPMNYGPSVPLQPQFPQPQQQQQQQQPYWANYPPGQPGRYGYQGL